MNEAAALLLEYKEFLPFCKTHADNDTYKCALTVSEWISINDNEWHYKVTSDRFLRGMVRLIVGMTLNIGLKRIELIDVKTAMDKQERLQRAWSVPAQGLYLSSIKYPQLG
jgi:tRNA pseudouridine38-40 synthase